MSEATNGEKSTDQQKMLFESKLGREIYEPWKDYYLSYNKLKKLLKEEVIIKNAWTEKDEQNFVSALDSDLEKVYTFQINTYDDLNEQLNELQAQTESVSANFDVLKFTASLELVLNLTQELNHFQRLNYTGFTKIVKKHDRLHPAYSVKPLLNVRLKTLPFHSEDYSPLLFKISALFQFLRDNYDVDQSLSKLSSFNDETVEEYQLFKFWSPNASTLRIKWIGPLYGKPDISIEKKAFEKHSETYDVDEKFTLKEKYLDSFVNGTFNTTKYLNKLKKKGKTPEEIEVARKHIESFTKYIEETHVQPCLRTTYKRTAFQIPGDDKVRVVIDSDIYFIREDAFDAQRPIRDPSKWHRTDIDSKVNNPLSLLRKGEFVKFPYAELEVKVRTKRRGKKILWIEDLVQSHLVKEIPHFSKFIHGIGSLFLEDDKLDNIPFWFNELEADMTFDPERAFLDTREKMAKLQNDEDNLKKFKSMLANSASPNFAPRSKSFSGSEMMIDAQRKSSHAEDLAMVQETGEEPDAASGVDLDDQSSDEDFEDEVERGFTSKLFKLPSTFSKLLDADSEDEEIDLPAGVAKPSTYIKNAGPLKIEPKVWLANERTFNRWLHVTTLLSTLTFIIYSSTSRANSTQLAEYLAYIYFALTLFSGFWGYHIFLKRRNIIMERSDKHLDSILGPLIVALGLILGLTVNFVYGFKSVASQQKNGFTSMGLTEDFYARNPFQKTILEFVFRLVGA
ncbi:hypothetical protein HF325_002039 [Metschnikowia pulcherrima]|uniref:SPX domain-containing protein n=1 Tax=Metschnikowia pulcherrima TaxID=27326 RepID=A0A8H7GUJ0_9ASCO|nr:hypothetical protein HF325_002039 [Metschnikowia pulcherrima]